MDTSFINKFFGFFDYGNASLDPYTDNLGEGAFGIRHFIWIIVIILLIALIFSLKNKNVKDKTYKIFKTLLIIMFAVRLIRQGYSTLIGVESPYWRAIFPIHLCSIMIYLLPIVVVFDLKKIKHPVYFLSILGGTITLIDGGYFDSKFMPFATIEGIYAHSLILIASIFMLRYENDKFDILDYIKSLIGIVIISMWATLFNIILGTYYNGSNYLYLVKNMLPMFDSCYIYIYLLIYVLLLTVFYIALNIKNINKLKNEIRNNWKIILLMFIIMAIMAYIITKLTRLFAIYG